MPNNSPETPKTVDEHVEEFLRRRHAGEVTSAERYLQEYPELGPEFRDILCALDLLEQDKNGLLGLQQTSDAKEIPLKPLRLPNYEILGEIGRGGMGIVYRALHKTLNREVALKVLPTSGMENPQLLARFEQEARACAKLHHTNIVPIFEVGSADGIPFFAMQLIDGLGLDRLIERLSRGHGNRHRHPASIGKQDVHDQVIAGFATWDTEDFYRQVAKIGLQASEALTCAHQHGVIHRDIKPANLILDRNQNVWLTDFGLAKLNESDLTRTGDVFGTLRYLAPERLVGCAEPNSDQYSLGMTLYELAALHPVWEKGDRFSVLERIRQHDPKPLRGLAPGLPRDLGTIIAKAMSKNLTDRYASTAELSDDLRRYLDGRPIRARRLGTVEQLVRWGKRNPALAASFSLIVVLLTAGLVSTFVAMNHFRSQRDIQAQLVETTRQLLYNSEMMSGFDEVRSPTGVSRVHEVLTRWQPKPGETDLRGWEWYYLRNASGFAETPQTAAYQWHGSALKPDQTQIAVYLGTVSIIDQKSQREITELMEQNESIVVAAGWMSDNRFVVVNEIGDVIRFHGETYAEVDRHSFDLRILGASIHPNEPKLALTTADSNLLIIDFNLTDAPILSKVPQVEPMSQAASDYSDDGKWLVSANSDLSVCLFESGSMKEVSRVASTHEYPFKQISFNPNGQRAVACGWDGRVSLIEWDDAKKATCRELTRLPTAVLTAVFVDHGSTIAFAGSDRVVHLWDIDANRLVRDFKGHLGSVESLQMITGDKLVSVARDGAIRTWTLDTPPPYQQLKFASEQLMNWSASWHPSGNIVTSAYHDIWERELITLQPTKQFHSERIAWNEQSSEYVSKIGKTLSWCRSDGTILGSALLGDVEILDVGGPKDQPIVAALVRNFQSNLMEAYLWEPKSRRDPQLLNGTIPHCYSMKIDRSGRRLVISFAGTGQLIDVGSHRVVQEFEYFGGGVSASAWNYDGTRLALGSEEGLIRIYAKSDGGEFTMERSLAGNRLRVRDLAWHPSGNRLASVGDDSCLNLWNTNTGSLIINQEHESAVIDVSWSPNGDSLATVSQWGELRIWNSGPRDK